MKRRVSRTTDPILAGRRLLPAVAALLEGEPTVEAVVLYGSSVNVRSGPACPDRWSDTDLHVVTRAPKRLEQMDWLRRLPRTGFHFRVVRPALGGVRKLVLLFDGGEVEMVLLPVAMMRRSYGALQGGPQGLDAAQRLWLNMLSNSVRPGYRFLKGEDRWGIFYAQVIAKMPGVRIADTEARRLAEIFLCDLLWVLQKLQRGELVAAQHMLHMQLSDVNLRLIRELRLRRNLPLPSFGVGRRLESLVSREELSWVRISARLRRDELHRAAWAAFAGMETLLGELVPAWKMPAGANKVLAPYVRLERKRRPASS